MNSSFRFVVLSLLSCLAAGASAQGVAYSDLHRMWPPIGETLAVELGDLDGDGDLDALASSWVQNTVLLHVLDSGFVVLPGAGAGSPAFDLALGDLDGDGDFDAVTSFAQVLLNDGTAHMTVAPAWLSTGGAEAVALADFDNDGDLDAIFARSGAPNEILINTGSGLVELPGVFAVPDGSEDVTVADLSGDGYMDFAIANYFAANVLGRNTGGSGFVLSSTALAGSGLASTGVATGDVEGDGDADLLFANWDEQDVLLANDGTAGFAPLPGALPPLALATVKVILADADGDQDPDLFARYSSPGELAGRFFRNNAGTFVEEPDRWTTGVYQTRDLAVGDVEPDGDLDAVLAMQLPWSTTDRLFLGDPAGKLVEVSSGVPPSEGETRRVLLGDFDGDGDNDAFLANWSATFAPAPTDNLFENVGSGVFEPHPGLPSHAAVGTFDAAMLDAEGDGDLDLVLALVGPNQVLANDGSGTFSELMGALPPDASTTVHVLAGDLDGDGDDDLLFDEAVGDRVLLNGGAGVFTPSTAALPPGLDMLWSLELGDLDADGDLDVVHGDSTNGFDALMNDGGGTFQSSGLTVVPGLFASVYDLDLGDLDGDGDLDLFLATAISEHVFLNNLPAGFTHAPGALPPLPTTWGAEAADLDLDGDLDLVCGSHILLWNDGSGAFATVPGVFVNEGTFTRALAVADLDGDQAPDVFFGSMGQGRVAFHLRRQLAWRARPRLGVPTTFDLYGEPNESWFLALSLTGASLPIPGVGILLLDPAGLVLLGGGVLDAGGRGSTTLPTPSNPLLLGLAVRFQAVLGPPFGFSNLELAVLSEL